MRFLAFLIFAASAQTAWALFDELKDALRGDPYPVIHSKYAVVEAGFDRLSWVDSDRLLFVGEPVEEVLARFDRYGKATLD